MRLTGGRTALAPETFRPRAILRTAVVAADTLWIAVFVALCTLRGATAAGFPNWMTIIGPNTGLGNSSMILMIESQLNYLSDALRAMQVNGWSRVEVRPEAQRSYNLALQRRGTMLDHVTEATSFNVIEADPYGMGRAATIRIARSTSRCPPSRLRGWRTRPRTERPSLRS